MSVLGNAKRDAVMRSLTFYQSTFEQVLRYIIMNCSAFLYCVKRDAIPKRKSVVCLQQICVSLVDFIAVNADNYFLFYLLASQLPTSDWYNVFQSELIAEACLDRIVHKAMKFALSGESLRKKY